MLLLLYLVLLLGDSLIQLCVDALLLLVIDDHILIGIAHIAKFRNFLAVQFILFLEFHHLLLDILLGLGVIILDGTGGELHLLHVLLVLGTTHELTVPDGRPGHWHLSGGPAIRKLGLLRLEKVTLVQLFRGMEELGSFRDTACYLGVAEVGVEVGFGEGGLGHVGGGLVEHGGLL